MRFFRLKATSSDDEIQNGRIFPSASAATLGAGRGLLLSGKISYGKYVDAAAEVFDHFSLASLSHSSGYDWILLDAYDFIGAVVPVESFGLLVSPKLRGVLETFRIAPPHRFYPAKLLYRGDKLDYFVFHPAHDKWANLVWERSEFTLRHRKTRETEPYGRAIRDYEDYNTQDKAARDTGRILAVSKACVRSHADLLFEYDRNCLAVSEPLKNAIESEGITGLETEPLEELEFSFGAEGEFEPVVCPPESETPRVERRTRSFRSRLAALFGSKASQWQPAGAPPRAKDDSAASRAVLPEHRLLEREAWLPVTEQTADNGARPGSYFGGGAVGLPGEQWPTCGHCDEPLSLFLQLRAEDLPPEAGQPIGPGTLQFFYCTSMKPVGPGRDLVCQIPASEGDPYPESSLLRVVPEGAATGVLDGGAPASLFPARRIVSWTSMTDCVEPPEIIDSEFPRMGDKLLGLPRRLQGDGAESLRCSDCGEAMQYFFQMESASNIPFAFGDHGYGYLYHCPKHQGRWAFDWTST